MSKNTEKMLPKRPMNQNDKQRLIFLWPSEEKGEKLFLTEGGHCFLGRFDLRTKNEQMIDLTGYAGAENISRTHAQLYMENDHIYLIDLESANGTFFRKNRIDPHQPVLLKDGDRFCLAKLEIEIRIRS